MRAFAIVSISIPANEAKSKFLTNQSSGIKFRLLGDRKYLLYNMCIFIEQVLNRWCAECSVLLQYQSTVL